MRNIIYIVCLAFLSTGLTAQVDAISTFFSNYQEDDAFSSVYISPKMFEMFANMETKEENEDLSRILKSIKGLRILSTDQDGTQLFKDAKSKLVKNSYEMLMNVKEEENDVEFLIKESDEGKIQELLLLVGGIKGFTLLSFVGDVSLKDLSSLASKMDIDGLEYLEQLEDKK